MTAVVLLIAAACVAGWMVALVDELIWLRRIARQQRRVTRSDAT